MAAKLGPEGFGHRLRPVERRDASAILALRTDPVLGRYLNPTSPDEAEQIRWIDAQRERSGDFYFVIESIDGTFHGTVSLYDVEGETGEWGRWILRRGSLAAPASVLLILSFGFETLGLSRIHCRTIDDNVQVLRFHDSCAYTTRHAIAGDGTPSFVEHAIVQSNWPAFRIKLEPIARRAARRGNLS